jgi:hypothetical protein
MQNYGVKCDAEELDMLDTAARQLEVRVSILWSIDHGGA